MRKLIVFGPTGKTGLAIIKGALENSENQVTVYVRRPERLPEELKRKVTSIVGDVLDEKSVAEAVKGQDVALSSLGSGSNLGKTTVMSDGVKNIVKGMKQHGVSRLVVCGVSFLLPERNRGPVWFLKNVTADHERMLNFLGDEKDIKWVAVMPPKIIDHPPTGTYKTAVNKLNGSEKVACGDIAHCMLSYASDEDKLNEHNGKLIGISSFISIPFWKLWSR